MAGERDESYDKSGRAVAQLTAVLIADNTERYRHIQKAAIDTGAVMLLRTPAGYPQGRELTLALNQASPEVVLLDLLDREKSEACATCLREQFPSTSVVGIGGSVREMPFVGPYPPSGDQLNQLIHQSMHELRRERRANLLAFLPAKAGSGASTIALNTASALADQGKRVLVIDADLYSGSLGAMVDSSAGHSLQKVLRGITDLDRFRLEEAVCEANGVDLLLSDGTPVYPMPGWVDYFRLLDVANMSYDAIVVDLPEVVNMGTQEFVQRARGVYMVTTQELVPIKLAGRRLEELAAWDVPGDSIHVVVNRWLKGEIKSKEIEALLKRPVAYEFPNDYRLVRKALNGGDPVAADSTLGRAFRDFAQKAMGTEQKKGGFLGGLLGLG